jgi:photosystem II stability/assembly factor-like uncharacterized protein
MHRLDGLRAGRILSVCLLLIFFSADLCAQQASRTFQLMRTPETMKEAHLVTQQAGWTRTSDHLYWTSDGGMNWSNVTPALRPHEVISAVFFLDAARGWVLLSHAGDADEEFELATTKTAGASWSTTQLHVPDPDPDTGLSAEAWVNFANASHGWVLVRMSTNTAVSWGVLIRTQDGGTTWQRLEQPPVAGPVYFASANEGWLCGGPDDSLHRTQDGGRHWQQVSIPVSSDANESYELPVFRDEKSGILSVLFDGPTKTERMLFSTSDGGLTWKAQGQVAQDDLARRPDTIVGSLWLGATTTRDQGIMLAAFPAGAKRTIRANVQIPGVSAYSVRGISFASPLVGWAIVDVVNCNRPGGAGCTELVSTSDGGTSWVSIAPPEIKPRPYGTATMVKPVPRRPE